MAIIDIEKQMLIKLEGDEHLIYKNLTTGNNDEYYTLLIMNPGVGESLI